MILLRHTEPVNCARLCYGRTDVSLRADFEVQAARVEAGLPEVRAIVTSPANRCRKLAEWIGVRRGLCVKEDARLAELDFGTWETRLWDDIPRSEIDAWAADVLHARPHGGENVAMLMARVRAGLDYWGQVPGPVLLVSHSGVARAAQALIGGETPWTSTLGFGEWMCL